MKMLRMNPSPYLNTYNLYGTTFSIASHDEEIWPWVYNNFIQIRYVPEWKSYFFDNHHLIFDNCPFYARYRIPQSMMEMKWKSLKECIIDSINLDCYVYLYVDRYFISKSTVYQKKKDIWHEILIYGYDSNKEIFYVADNLREGKYVLTESDFNEIEVGYNSILSDNDFYKGITLLQKRDGDFTFKIGHVKEQLLNYLSSTPTQDMAFKEESIFGMNAWMQLISDLKEKTKVDKRAFHLFWEHKKVMVDRITYLESEKYLKPEDGSFFKNEFVLMEKRAFVLRNLALKYMITQEYQIKIQLIEELVSSLERENELITKLINNLEIKQKEEDEHLFTV
ncbi:MULTISPECIES: hypothetical protein [Paenibacillus]|uniref:Butirosin biosynthesis protein H N-terminal domain-containing protein n=1 Tax=Paenibacillus cucumis (ex Kampfer et al. 2016) TaxID=1776858 RepID=A0ABS7KPQ7_9BACL|nr:hypothetical protein [Paenibacillus cucumis (ex Kampfer et al. 2016)]MBY0205901.1 hypothetical protein [Paenibacillus cucumis (ex Kampfer et al. 2016)]